MIAVVNIDSGHIFLDATSDVRPYNLIAVNELNYYGLRISETGSEWLRIQSTTNTSINITGSIVIDSALNLSAKMALTGKEYEAVALRMALRKKEAAEIIKKTLQITDELTVTENRVENQQDLEKKLRVSFTLEGKKLEATNNLIYFMPLCCQIWF